MLSRAGVPFTVRNVEVDLGAYRDLVARGFRTVPVTLVGDEPPLSVVGFNAPALRRAVGIAEPP